MEERNNEKIKFIKRNIHDDNLKLLIFELKSIDEIDELDLKDSIGYIQYFYDIVVIATAIIYKAYLNWSLNLSSDELEKILLTFDTPSKRAYDYLKTLYNNPNNKFDIDFIDKLLEAIQIDNRVNPGNNFLTTIGLNGFINIKENFKFNKYITYFSLSKASPRNYREQLYFGYEELKDVITTFNFLQKTYIEFNEINELAGSKYKSITVEYDDLSLNLDELILKKKRNFYYLETIEFVDSKILSIDNEKKQILKLKYISHNYKENIELNCSNYNDYDNNTEVQRLYKDDIIENLLFKYDILVPIVSDDKEHFFKDYVSINNKYIKYFSMILSEAMSLETKIFICNKYREKYKDIFKRLSINGNEQAGTTNNYRWDELTIFLLLEEGIYHFLSSLVFNNKITFNDIKLKFITRYHNEIDKAIKKCEINEKLINVTATKKNTDGIVKSIIKLATELLSIEKIKFKSISENISIMDNINYIKRVHDGSLSADQKIMDISLQVLKILSYLCIFYKGLGTYLLRKTSYELSLNLREDISYTEFKKENIRNLKSFTETVQYFKSNYSDYYKIIKYNFNKTYCIEVKNIIKNYFDELISINDEILPRENEYNQAYYKCLGKRMIFNDSEMMDYCNSFIEIYDALIDANDNNVNQKFVDALYNISFKFLVYLGGYNKDSNDNYIQNFEKSIYPLIGTYLNGEVSSDGYRSSHFAFDNNLFQLSEIKVKFIIDDDFDFDDLYFCLPNINRTSKLYVRDSENNQKREELIWISPVVIPYYYVFPNNTRDDHLKIEQLHNPDDFVATAEILYYTDENIYGNLFGSVDNAKNVLPYLFNNELSTFNKKYFYVMKLDDKVIGVVSLYRNRTIWNPDTVIKSFNDAKVDLPESSKYAFKYFNDTFNESMSGMYMICDLCITKSYRKKGYGKKLLKYINELAREEGHDLIITVYKDNDIALKMYNDLSFCNYNNGFDNGGSKLVNDKEYLYLVKFNSFNDMGIQ